MLRRIVRSTCPAEDRHRLSHTRRRARAAAAARAARRGGRIGTLLGVQHPQPAEHEFGIVLGPSASQNDAYVTCGAPMLEAALNGHDSLLFAFGANATGKTYSLYGADGGKSQNVSRLDGIVPSVVTDLFKRTLTIEKGGESKFALSATLVKLQGNHLVDLFADEGAAAGQGMVGNQRT